MCPNHDGLRLFSLKRVKKFESGLVLCEVACGLGQRMRGWVIKSANMFCPSYTTCAPTDGLPRLVDPRV
jgi:hypothetical protein